MAKRRGGDGVQADRLGYDNRYLADGMAQMLETRRSAKSLELVQNSPSQSEEVIQAERDAWIQSLLQATDRIKDFGDTPEHGKRDPLCSDTAGETARHCRW